MKVITYQAPNGKTIDLTRKQVRALSVAQSWPRNESGEYCTISHGLHDGEPTLQWCAFCPHDHPRGMGTAGYSCWDAA